MSNLNKAIIISISEQAEAIKDGRQFELVRDTLAKDVLTPTDYESVITISPKELLKYLRAKYKLDELVITKPSASDGFYVVKKHLGYLTYLQERQIHFNQAWVLTTKQAWKQYVTYQLGFNFGA